MNKLKLKYEYPCIPSRKQETDVIIQFLHNKFSEFRQAVISEICKHYSDLDKTDIVIAQKSDWGIERSNVYVKGTLVGELNESFMMGVFVFIPIGNN